jgi:hypothetical protein
MKHRNEQSGIDKQGRLRTKRKPAHRHGNSNYAPKKQLTKKRMTQVPGGRGEATMTHEEFAGTLGVAEKQHTQEAQTTGENLRP